MRKRILRSAIALILALSMPGCAAQKKAPAPEANDYLAEDIPGQAEYDSGSELQTDDGDVTVTNSIAPIYNGRPLLIKAISPQDENAVVPCATPYTLEPDLSNVYNLNQFYLGEDEIEKLYQNGFLVYGSSGSEFFQVYETNRYTQIPNFVTVDSLMHTYHLYFSYLLKNIERSVLANYLTQLSVRMLENSITQYNLLKGSEWETAAERNVAFFTVGASLLDADTPVRDHVADVVRYELDNINRSEEIAVSAITGDYEDYTQYKPRGYYEGNVYLEQYFKAMMWYGRLHFRQEEADMDRSALLITKALADDTESYSLWASIYAATTFFAGASDDLGACEYAAVIQEVYGDNLTIPELPGDSATFDRFHTMTAKLRAPQINSIPIADGDSNVIPGFRFMGQRFTIDAAIMQELIYSRVKENNRGQKRMLPDVLDLPAALGSDIALNILEQQGATAYEGYPENMNRLRDVLAKEDSTLWTASLYANWLNTLRPLLTVKEEGYPVFMQNEEWAKKDLECFAGSFTELKHDTVLYSKQVMAEMGGGYDEYDFRGYVEPEPLVYKRFASLASQTAQGLKDYGMLDPNDEENLSRLAQMAEWLYTISRKELCNEALTDDEYEFIETYGGNIEHFWMEAVKGSNDTSGPIYAQEYPAAVVVDIATDPDSGTVLETATGNPATIYVVVQVDGRIKIAKGSVYSFYQFPWAASDRLTDSAWRQMMGLQADEEGNYNYGPYMDKPEWTESYRYHYSWE